MRARSRKTHRGARFGRSAEERQAFTAAYGWDVTSWPVGTLSLILDALAEADVVLADDSWAAYVCVRHGEQATDAGLAGFFLCTKCHGR